MAFRPEIRTPQSGVPRRGRGFSLEELKAAKINLADARWMAIPVDSRRKSHHAENVKTLQDYVKRIKKLGKEAKKPRTKPKAEKPAPIKTKAIETNLTELSGITKKTAETLVAVGIANIHDLSTTSPRRLARRTDLKRDRAERLIETAKRYEQKKSKAAREEKVEEPQIRELKHLPEITRDDVRNLQDLGVKTFDDLKAENPRDLSLLTGIPETRIKEWRKIIRELDKA